MLSFKIFMVSGLILRPVIQVVFVFEDGLRKCSNLILLYAVV